MPEKKIDSPKCFVMMPFRSAVESGYPENHFEMIYLQIIKPAIEKAGMVPIRSKDSCISSNILEEIYESVVNCDMAICDLSTNNPNVLYELGLRHAYDKPVLLVKDERTKHIFDITSINTIYYKSDRLYENVIDAIADISKALRENLERPMSILKSVQLSNKFRKAEYSKVDSEGKTNADFALLEMNNKIEMMYRMLKSVDLYKSSDINKENQIRNSRIKRINDEEVLLYVDSLPESYSVIDADCITENDKRLKKMQSRLDNETIYRI